MANPVKILMWNIQENSSISMQRKRKSKTNPNFVFLKKRFQFVHKVGQDGNRSKKKLRKFL